VIEIPGNRMAELAAAGKTKSASNAAAPDAYSEIHGSPRTAPVAGGVVRLVYGLISSPTMSRLQDQGSWKARASAIEDVLATVADMSEADVRLVRPHIPELFKFLAAMLNDANFKISITTLHILEALVQKLGPHTRGPHANLLVKDLVNQLGANKAVVRQAALQVFTSLLQVRDRRVCEAGWWGGGGVRGAWWAGGGGPGGGGGGGGGGRGPGGGGGPGVC
jgi:hypothetical protein